MSKLTKYAPDTIREFLDAIHSGSTVKAACTMAESTIVELSVTWEYAA